MADLVAFKTSQLLDATANGRSLITADDYAAMMQLLIGGLPTTDPGVVGEPWVDANGFVKQSLGTTNLYQVSGFSDSNYFVGPAGTGLSTIGTIRLVGKLLTVPTSGQKILFGRSTGSTGWYVATGLQGAGTLDVVGSAVAYGLPATFTSGDVGKVFTMHATLSGGVLKSYFGGIFAHSVACTATAADAGAGFIVGRFEPLTSYSNNNIAVIDIATSNTAMTDQQIYDDAVIIQQRTSNFRIEDLPSQLHRFNADDIVTTTNWVSQSGSLTLTRNGTLTVEAY